MPLPAGSQSSIVDGGGVAEGGLALANNMSPTNRELRAIRILLEVLLMELTGKDINVSLFTTTEALEG